MAPAAPQPARALARIMPPPPLTRDALEGWLRLAGARGLSAAALRTIVGAFAPLEAVFGATHAALAALVGDAGARAVLAPPPDGFAAQVAATLAWLDAHGNRVVTLHDPAYPATLAHLYDPPPVLYVKGRADLLQAHAIAIVGSRHATPQGIADATRFAREISAAGLTIVSGLARGIDGAAHRGGLAGAGSTIAVIGTGADLVYPAQHRSLAHEIAEHGAIVSEWPLGTPARTANFPQRNRLIAGLTLGVLIVEAAPRSGSLITARLANEMGRDVFAIPGSIHAPLSQGCHALIQEGAKLAATVADVLDEFGIRVETANERATTSEASTAPRPRARQKTKPDAGPSSSRPLADADGGLASALSDEAQLRSGAAAGPGPRHDGSQEPHAATRSAASTEPPGTQPPPSADEARLLDALGYGPVPLELIGERSGLSDDALHRLLLQLELAGRIAPLPGGRVMRLETDATALKPAGHRTC